MKPSNLFKSDDRAVSPVTGVILMVAITVILAAVIGTFVLGLGDQVSDTAPQASFTIDGNDSSVINVTKTGGQTVDTADLTLSVDGQVASSSIDDGNWETGEQKSLDYSSITSPSGEVVVRIIHDPSGNVILEQNYDFS
ncbi:type IV pilin [Halorubrum sp. SD626R]|uniref:type IV pilin n=1 Tax=Halorubrum sp. SD626R TaxID=1419722 RepID=UPI000ACE6116|nr:type IV pilin N-terminal domain-containing protein [Halorubrum sp. SD626R]TKX80878.1 type IV pilin [Halorubrum sp. SD626R]